MLLLLLPVVTVSCIKPESNHDISAANNESDRVLSTVDVQNLYPLVPPDVNNGADIFANECESCHGKNIAANDLYVFDSLTPVPFFTEENMQRMSAPVRWFLTVTYGDIGNGMPGFNHRLDTRQCWDVVAYLTLLNYSVTELETGKKIYSERCSSCHGEAYSGNTMNTQISMIVWDYSNRLAQRSDHEIWMKITKGAGDEMPSFEGIVTDEERWAVTSFIRSLSYLSAMYRIPSEVNSRPIPSDLDKSIMMNNSLSTDTQSEIIQDISSNSKHNNECRVTITGNVIHSKGNPLSGLSEIVLQQMDQSLHTITVATSNVKEDGNYKFSSINIDQSKGEKLIVAVDYEETTFFAEPIFISSLYPDSEIYQKIVIYETSRDGSSLIAERWHVFLDFSKQDIIQVLEYFIISNPSEKLIVPNLPDAPILIFQLPGNAINLTKADDQNSISIDQTLNRLSEYRNVKPKSNFQVAFSYDMPFDKKDRSETKTEQNLSLTAPISVESAVVMVPDQRVRLEGDILQEVGEQNIRGTDIQVYSTYNLEKGGKLNFKFTRKIDFNEWFQGNSILNILVGLVVLIFSLFLALGLLYNFWQRDRVMKNAVSDANIFSRSKKEKNNQRASDNLEVLLDKILALDDAYRAGKISESAFRNRRQEIIQQIRRVKSHYINDDK